MRLATVVLLLLALASPSAFAVTNYRVNVGRERSTAKCQ